MAKFMYLITYKNNDRTASKKWAGGDDKQVLYFTWPIARLQSWATFGVSQRFTDIEEAVGDPLQPMIQPSLVSALTENLDSRVTRSNGIYTYDLAQS